MPKGNPTPPLVGGITNGINSGNVSTILQGNVFQSGIHKPEHSNFLSFLYPQFYVTTLIDRLGASCGIASDTHSWNEMDRTRRAVTILTANTGAVTSEPVELTDVTSEESYAIVGDVFRTEAGNLFKVTVINSPTNSNQNVTLAKLDNSTFTIESELIDEEQMGHVGNIFAENSSAPNGRLYLPNEEFNYTHISRRSNKISGTEFTNRSWLKDGKSWYWNQQMLDLKEFGLDKEATVMFGERTAGTNVKSMRGIWDYVSTNGYEQTYAQSATPGDIESDLQTLIRVLMVRGCSSELTVFAGSKLMERIQIALKDYAIDGALSYGSFGANIAGLDFQAYKYMGIKLNFFYYRLFDDKTILPFSGTPTASKIDFSDCGLVLDFGSGGGLEPDRKIKLCHKELAGSGSRQFISYVKPGLMQPDGANGGIVSVSDDSFEYGFLSEYTLEVRGSHTMGILRSNS